MPDYLIKALFVLSGLMLTYELISLLPRTKHPAVHFVIHAVTGVCALLVANIVGEPFGLGLGLNALTLPVSAGLGVPGTALLWALRYWL